MFQEPDILASFDRSWGDKKEELRLERGEYEGKPQFTLRLYWQGQDGKWRWASQKPTQSGKCWERLNLRGSELKKLAAALIQASKANETTPVRQQERRRQSAVLPGVDGDDSDDIPF